ncbi:uncharacterized protein NECHADRAFT_87549 [Fusarium vanettenii 77-13-4]|uniref:Mid2 domain-containing protein n=1 Tax=Fusarium vanettenii (strain ATCC MYA-4622 / CBS 123669 / FGSC 9596 / NRRL 45880 / 77-13-4) TaxID=660122 RepID=C7ZE95_FUSV7|nr:uncharacterized protein NECHADRAFT_87549 [Fusarium vanettenii 77-13-4]EEU37726.1 hypothetical protein NECHADRAFT_87549 [Fusarium vanettenii 77-13-4]
MAEIQPTGLAVAPVFDVAGPAVTAPATLHQRDLFGRQNNYDSCGYYSLPDNGWATWQCGEENAWTTTCKTIGSHFGCFQNIYTTCYPSASSCDSTNARALCCTEDTNFPYCATGIKPLEGGDGDELSIYLCGKTEQQVPFYESTVVRITTGSTTEEQTLTSIDTTRGVVIVTKTAEPSPEPDDKSSTPIGAIVGGVVGGVALIAILGLAFWFLRRKKGNKEVATTPAAPAPAPGFSPQQQQQQMGYQQGVPPPVVYDYNNNNYAGYPVQGSPPPPSDPRYSQMPVGGMSPPPQSPPIEYYKPVASPVSELPATSSPHDNTPVSELPADMGNLPIISSL